MKTLIKVLVKIQPGDPQNSIKWQMTLSKSDPRSSWAEKDANKFPYENQEASSTAQTRSQQGHIGE